MEQGGRGGDSEGERVFAGWGMTPHTQGAPAEMLSTVSCCESLKYFCWLIFTQIIRTHSHTVKAIRASIRVREVPIRQCQLLITSHSSTQHTALELRARQGRVHGWCSCS